ncbi:MAG: hypothetical protein JW839_19185 [Candidatus Lokiarchaeota archaeon]|nr:hypothetical protein [Candidatus Lokiarchaeota archaeon]
MDDAKPLDSLVNSIQGWTFGGRPFKEAWIVTSRDSRNPGGHVEGLQDFLATRLPGDTRFHAVPNPALSEPANGVHAYDARSRIPLKLDAYKQDLLREYIEQYLASKTPAQKATLTVADMAAWIVVNHGNELGMSAAPDAAWGIPVASELRFAVNRFWQHGVCNLAMPGINLDTMVEDPVYVPNFKKITPSTSLHVFESLVSDMQMLEGFYFETRDYTLRVLELDVDRVEVIRENMRIIDLLCAWAGVTNALRGTTNRWWNV